MPRRTPAPQDVREDLFVLVSERFVKMVLISERGIEPVAAVDLSSRSDALSRDAKRLTAPLRVRRIFLSTQPAVPYAQVTAPLHKALAAVAARKGVTITWLPDLIELVDSTGDRPRAGHGLAGALRRWFWWRLTRRNRL